MVVLNQDGDDPAGDIIAVYDHAHPAAGCEGVLAVEALASCPWIGTQSAHFGHKFQIPNDHIATPSARPSPPQGPPTAPKTFTRNNNNPIQPRTGRQATTQG